MTINTVEGGMNNVTGSYAVVLTRWNSFVVEHLKEGAIKSLISHGIEEENITVYYVPGAYELPLVARKLAKVKKYDAIIALGAVIRGATPHFDYVAGECSRGLAQVSLESEIPVAFGVLTVDTIEQAIERSGTKAGNKGEEAAVTALEMVSLLKKI